MAGLKENLDIIQRKAKERTVKTQTIEFDLETIVKKIDRNVIKLNPEYQRNHRWGDDVSSRLIESLMLNIPIPLIYISQDVDVDEEIDDNVSRYSVIDGQQRLTAIYKFFKNEFSLTDLPVLKELNGTNYKDLPPFLIRRLEERTIRCLRIDSTVDQQVKYDIFERLNSGAVKLEAQELRNATCRGPFKNLIKVLAENEDFLEICQLSENSSRIKKMEDQELVLRFFAITYNDGYKEYRGGFRDFLTEKMKEFNKLPDTEIDNMKIIFIKTVKKIRESFGEAPFSKYRYENDELVRMSKFNSAVYDSIIVPFVRLEDGVPPDYEDFKKIFNDDEYFTAVEGSVNDVSKLEKRILKGREAIH